MASQIFDIDWSHGWGTKSVSSSYIVASDLTPPTPYCCDTEVGLFQGGELCTSEVKFQVFAQSMSTCLLNQASGCTPDGLREIMTEETARGLTVVKSLQAYIARLAIEGMPDLGIYGLRNSPGIQTYQISNYANLSALQMSSALGGVWPLASSPFSNMFDSDSVGNDWVMIGGTKILAYLKGMMFPGTMANVLGQFTGQCAGPCGDLGISIGPDSIVMDTLLDGPPEIYLIRRKAVKLVANLFDENGGLSSDGSIVRACPPAPGGNCLSATKLWYFRYAGLLMQSQNDVIRIRFTQ
jgi:hypothetical protein